MQRRRALGLGRDLDLGSPEGSRDEDGAAARADVQRDRHQRRAAQAEQLDEDVAADDRAQYRAERVQPVEPGDPPADVRVLPHQVPGQDRQRHAHQQRHRGQREEGEPEPDELDLHRRQRQVGRPEERRDHVEGQRHQQRQAADDDLQQSVHGQRPAQPGRHGGADQCPDAEPGQEGGHGRDNGERRVAEDQDEVLGPDDLIDQPRGPRGHEDHGHPEVRGRGEEAAAPRSRLVHAGIRCSCWSGHRTRQYLTAMPGSVDLSLSWPGHTRP